MAKQASSIIELTDSYLKILQTGEQRGRKAVSALHIQPIASFNDAEIAKQLKETIQKKKLKLHNMIGIIPRRFVILKHFSLPSQQEGEIKKMIDLQIAANVPYPKDDIAYDYLILDKDSEGYCKVLVIVVHKDVINRYLKIYTEAGVSPAKLTLSSIGIVEWYAFMLKGKLPEPAVVIHVDDINSEICFENEGKFVFSRNINFGARDLNEDKIEAFIKQFQLTTATYVKDQMGPSIVKAVILSSAPMTNLLEESLIRSLDIPVQVMSPLDYLVCDKKINLSLLKSQAAVSIAAGAGELFSKDAGKINLMSDEQRSTKVSKQKVRQLVRVGLMFIMTCVFGLLALSFDYYRMSTYFDDIKKETAKIEKKAEKASQKIRLVNFLRDRVDGRMRVADVFYQLYDLTPSDIAYKNFTVSEDGLISVDGLAQNGSSVNDFQANLVNSAVFRDVNLQFSKRSRIFNQELTDFKITFRLKPYQKG